MHKKNGMAFSKRDGLKMKRSSIGLEKNHTVAICNYCFKDVSVLNYCANNTCFHSDHIEN